MVRTTTTTAHRDLAEAPEPAALNLPDLDDEAAVVAWRIHDLGSAAWAMRKLADAESTVAEVTRTADLEIERIQLWAAARIEAERSRVAFLRAHLEAYAIAQRDAGQKTITLPHGVIATRPIGGGVTVTDADAFIAWARSAGRHDLVRVKEEPIIAAARAALTVDAETATVHSGNGEVVDGVAVAPRGVSVIFKFAHTTPQE